MSFLSAALAQGTIEFSATLFAGDPGLRDRSQLIEVGFARFTLTGERSFSGYANMDVYFGATGFHVSDSSFNLLRNATSVTPLGDPGSGPPFGSYRVVWDAQPLTESQVGQLFAGELRVYVPSATRSPNGDVVGQIMIVPEPSTSLLLIVSGFGLIAFYRYSR